jgi:hypothetical protein
VLDLAAVLGKKQMAVAPHEVPQHQQHLDSSQHQERIPLGGIRPNERGQRGQRHDSGSLKEGTAAEYRSRVLDFDIGAEKRTAWRRFFWHTNCGDILVLAVKDHRCVQNLGLKEGGEPLLVDVAMKRIFYVFLNAVYRHRAHDVTIFVQDLVAAVTIHCEDYTSVCLGPFAVASEKLCLHTTPLKISRVRDPFLPERTTYQSREDSFVN